MLLIGCPELAGRGSTADFPHPRRHLARGEPIDVEIVGFQDALNGGARRSDPLQVDDAPDGRAIAAARKRINATFDVVEAIAKRYGAWPPRTPTRL